MAQVAEHLLSKCKVLSSSPSTTKKNNNKKRFALSVLTGVSHRVTSGQGSHLIQGNCSKRQRASVQDRAAVLYKLHRRSHMATTSAMFCSLEGGR
jgi:hypothetical protein